MKQATLGLESDYVRLALDLGADSAGGALSVAERSLLSDAGHRPASDARLLVETRELIHAGHDPLGIEFLRANSPIDRRAVGAFYTPCEIVEPMVEWAIAEGAEGLVDPGCGSGRFSMYWRRKYPKLPIVAVDADAQATIMTRAALSVLGARNVRVLNQDFMTVELGNMDRRMAFVGNPPYVRHHGLSAEMKLWGETTACALNLKLSGLAGLHIYFFLAVLRHARPGDLSALVTSAEWLDVGYGAILREALVGRLGGSHISAMDPKLVPFSDAMTTACITCFRPGAATTGISFQSLPALPESGVLGDGRYIAADLLRQSKRWSQYIRGVQLNPSEGSLGDIARVHRGVATGANQFFVMSRADAIRRGLERWMRPVITTGAEILNAQGVIHDSPNRRVLVVLPPDIDRYQHPAVDVYLCEGEHPGDGSAVSDRYLAQHRRPWWNLGRVEAPPIVASYMARRTPAFAANPDGLVLLNIAHGVFPRVPLPSKSVEKLVDYLNAKAPSFSGLGRTYHGGLEKFEPSEMEHLPVTLKLLDLVNA